MPIEEKESVRWLDNLAQSTELLGAPDRCVHIGDREGDIYELFCLSQDLGTHFLIRTCNNRRAGDGDHTVDEEMEEVAVKGLHRVDVRDANGNSDEAVLQVRYRKVRVLPPIGKWKRYPALTLWVLHAEEARAPRNRKRISWKLITDLPITSRRSAIEKLEWYSMRWKIEVFHKILKSGCKAEDSKASDSAASDQPDRDILHCELASLLDDHAQPDTKCAARSRFDKIGNAFARASTAGTGSEREDALPLSDQTRQARGLSRPCQRPAARQCRHLARPIPPPRHRAGSQNHGELWVIESASDPPSGAAAICWSCDDPR